MCPEGCRPDKPCGPALLLPCCAAPDNGSSSLCLGFCVCTVELRVVAKLK